MKQWLTKVVIRRSEAHSVTQLVFCWHESAFLALIVNFFDLILSGAETIIHWRVFIESRDLTQIEG